MKPGNINKRITRKGEFGAFNNRKLYYDGKYKIFSLGYKLENIYEGSNISFVEDPFYISPFKIFGYDHQGGKNILFSA